jgi:hypothetical protein
MQPPQLLNLKLDDAAGLLSVVCHGWEADTNRKKQSGNVPGCLAAGTPASVLKRRLGNA